MDRSERLRQWYALLQAKAYGDKAAEEAAQAALAPAVAEFREKSRNSLSGRVEALAHAVALATANDNG